MVLGLGIAGHGTAVLVRTALNPPILYAKSRNPAQSHHPWPKYLGGPEKQPRLNLPTELHEKYHTGLDKIFSRFKGSVNWDQLSHIEKREILDQLREFSRRFDAANNTNTLDALEKALREAGVVP